MKHPFPCSGEAAAFEAAGGDSEICPICLGWGDLGDFYEVIPKVLVCSRCFKMNGGAEGVLAYLEQEKRS